MAQINLTEDEKIQIMEAINQGLEPSTDLLPKIFPRTAEKFDVVALERAKIPTLEYAGKRTKAAILAEGAAGIGAAPLQVVRCFGDSPENDWRNLIVQGDNLQFLKTCYKNTDPLIKDKVKGKVKLIYIDPPFATKSDFGGKDGEYSYSDKVDRATFLETLRERLIYLRELLSDEGVIYIHLDDKMAHYVKVILDEIFGKNRFINEIIWHYGQRNMPLQKQLNRKHDSILFYSKTENYDFLCPRVPYTKEEVESWWNVHVDENGKKYYLENAGPGKPRYKRYIEDIVASGKTVDDVWDLRMIQSSSMERTGYPTQKPEELLERIISASSSKSELVVDIFAGSGTTVAVAEKLGRRWIACDFGKHAIYTMQKRILRISESKKLGGEDKKDEKYGLEPKPFCVASSGAYDFTHIMDMRKNKESYIDFALGLFQLARDDEKAAKFKIPNIYGVKENNPVEVYPVWDDSYLKEIRIDDIYLQGISC